MNLESEAFEMFVHEMLLVSWHSCGPGFHFTKEAENIIFRSLLNTFLNVQGFGTRATRVDLHRDNFLGPPIGWNNTNLSMHSRLSCTN